MKRRSSTIIRGLALAAALAAPLALPADEGRLVYGLVPNAPPTTYVDAAGKPTGFFIELYSRIMDELGIAYEYRVAPFPEIYPKMIAGEVDFFTTLQKTPEREALFIFPQKGVAAGWSQLFVALGTELQSVLDLQHRRIGMVKDDRNGLNFRSYMGSLAIPYEPVEYDDFEALVKGVQRGEVFGGVQSNWFVSAEKRVSPTTIVFAPLSSYPVLSRASVHRRQFDRIVERSAALMADPGSYYYELQAKWLGHERTETVVVPVWVIAGLGALLAATIVSTIVIRVLTGRLRAANRDLERKVRERTELLVKSERMTALGTMVAGIAHGLNSPLQALVTSAASIESRAAGDRACPPDPDGLLRRVRRLRAAAPFPDEADSLAARAFLRGRLEAARIPVDPGFEELCLDLGISDPSPQDAAALRGASSELLAAAREEADQERSLRIVKESADRLGSVVQALSIYARQDRRGDEETISIPRQIDAVLALYSGRTTGRIEVETDYDEQPSFRCRPDRLQRVWLNLIGNAVDAMGEKGKLTIRARSSADGPVVSVGDDGPGIPEGIQARIFDPFFSTKALGTSTGLGLSVAREIAEEHGGSISFESRPGRTIFTVRLPAASAHA